MKIEITKAGSRGFCEEVTYIRTNYVRVHNNPGRPAKTITNYMGIRIIGFFIVAMVALYLAVSTKDPIYMAATAAMAIAVVAVFLSYSGSRKKVYELMDDDTPKTLDMDEEYVTYTSGDKTLKYSWDEILCVALNKRSIGFLPRKLKGEAFFVDAEYKDQVIRGLKEAEHSYLLEDNVSRDAE
jgi:hypothetical protein